MELALVIGFAVALLAAITLHGYNVRRAEASRQQHDAYMRDKEDIRYMTIAKSMTFKYLEAERLLNDLKATIKSDYRVDMDQRVVAVQVLFSYDDYCLMGEAVFRTITAGSKDLASIERMIDIYKRLEGLLNLISVQDPKYIKINPDYKPILINHDFKLADRQQGEWNGKTSS